jgi:hypothetical protein
LVSYEVSFISALGVPTNMHITVDRSICEQFGRR